MISDVAQARIIGTPTPKRSTFASQDKAFKKLITPFRSPLMKETKTEDLVPSRPPSVVVEAFSAANRVASVPAVIVDEKRHRTTRAAAQFKSPLTAQAAASIGDTSIRLTPAIQVLERKVQLLKRAVKVKADREKEVLKNLIKIWTEAGREASYELFELGKDREGSGNAWSGGVVRKFEDSWQWSTQEGTKRLKVEDQSGTWGWDTSASEAVSEGEDERVIDVGVDEESINDDDYEEERSEPTVGTMLRQLGADPVILGWNDDEGTFVDK
ncbi:hypothetical protein L218DRAFT_864606 [Marasmius fiardii PR-910]|nr:hypothetical protein L218DRAFT_864606 [Marasmius fiardii PR-910]